MKGYCKSAAHWNRPYRQHWGYQYYSWQPLFGRSAASRVAKSTEYVAWADPKTLIATDAGTLRLLKPNQLGDLTIGLPTWSEVTQIASAIITYAGQSLARAVRVAAQTTTAQQAQPLAQEGPPTYAVGGGVVTFYLSNVLSGAPTVANAPVPFDNTPVDEQTCYPPPRFSTERLQEAYAEWKNQPVPIEVGQFFWLNQDEAWAPNVMAREWKFTTRERWSTVWASQNIPHFRLLVAAWDVYDDEGHDVSLYGIHRLSRDELECIGDQIWGKVPFTIGTPYVGIPDEIIGLLTERGMPSGFGAALYKDSRSGKFILAFRGTDQLVDMATANLPQGAGLWSAQYANAVKIIRALEQVPELKGKLIITGHSLGGGLSAVASMVSDKNNPIPAVLFNPAGPNAKVIEAFRGDTSWYRLVAIGDYSEADVARAKVTITSYVIRGEVLDKWVNNDIVGPKAIGTIWRYPAAEPITGVDGFFGCGLHVNASIYRAIIMRLLWEHSPTYKSILEDR